MFFTLRRILEKRREIPNKKEKLMHRVVKLSHTHTHKRNLSFKGRGRFIALLVKEVQHLYTTVRRVLENAQVEQPKRITYTLCTRKEKLDCAIEAPLLHFKSVSRFLANNAVHQKKAVKVVLATAKPVKCVCVSVFTKNKEKKKLKESNLFLFAHTHTQLGFT